MPAGAGGVGPDRPDGRSCPRPAAPRRARGRGGRRRRRGARGGVRGGSGRPWRSTWPTRSASSCCRAGSSTEPSSDHARASPPAARDRLGARLRARDHRVHAHGRHRHAPAAAALPGRHRGPGGRRRCDVGVVAGIDGWHRVEAEGAAAASVRVGVGRPSASWRSASSASRSSTPSRFPVRATCTSARMPRGRSRSRRRPSTTGRSRTRRSPGSLCRTTTSCSSTGRPRARSPGST